MKTNKLFILIIKIFTFLVFLLCFFIPHKAFIYNNSYCIATFGYIYHKESGVTLLLGLLILFFIVTITIIKNYKIANIMNLLTSLLMLMISFYYLYDGVFNVETYFNSTSIIGLASVIMLILSILSLLIYSRGDKIFSYFNNKKKVKSLIKKTILVLFSILVFIGFFMPLSITDWSINIPGDILRLSILQWNGGLINLGILLAYFIIILLLNKFDIFIIKIVSFLALIVTTYHFVYIAINYVNAWFTSSTTFGIAIPYMIIISIISFFIYFKNDWMLKLKDI